MTLVSRSRAGLVAMVVLAQLMLSATVAFSGPRTAKPYDFNGDGLVDLAVGVSGEGVGRVSGAGAVNVLYATSGGLRAKRSQIWSQATPGVKGRPGKYEGFGHTLASGDFDCDGYADLAVEASPKVAILYGSRRGLTARDQLLGPRDFGGRWDDSGVELEMATGDFDRNGCSELAISGGEVVSVFSGSSRGLSMSRRVDLRDTGCSPERCGGFGMGLATGDVTDDGIEDLVIGGSVRQTPGGLSGGVMLVPGSARGLGPEVGRRLGAEQRNIHRPDGSPFLSSYFGSAMVVADIDGDGHAELAVGDWAAGNEVSEDELGNVLRCPGSSVCSGAVVVFKGGSGGPTGTVQVLDKASLPIEYPSQFGGMLAAGDLDGDGKADLAFHQRWYVMVLYGSAAGLDLTSVQEWSEDSPGVKGQSGPEDWDQFGCGGLQIRDLGKGRQADLVIGSNLYRGYGAVNVLYGSRNGATSIGDQLWHQDVKGVPGRAEGDDDFGGTPPCDRDEG
jgi:hypothetical protein